MEGKSLKWGDEISSLGTLSIRVEKESRFAAFTRREITMTSNISTRVQKVQHLHFKAWPDQAIPRPRAALASFLMEVCELEAHEARHSQSPILVHCDDSAIRSGIFVTLYNLLDESKANGGVASVLESIKQLRHDQVPVVRTKEQLSLIYDVLNVIGSRALDSLPSDMSDHQHRKSKDGVTEFLQRQQVEEEDEDKFRFAEQRQKTGICKSTRYVSKCTTRIKTRPDTRQSSRGRVGRGRI